MGCDSVAIPLLRQTVFLRGLQQPRAGKSVKLIRTADHVIGKLVDFDFRALRVLRGDARPFSTAERHGTQAQKRADRVAGAETGTD